MYIDFSALNPFIPYLPLVLPFVVTLLAGILRQDGLPANVNKGITTVLVLAASAFAAFYNHALTLNLPLDMTVILGYTTAIMRIPEMRNLQGYIQTNWLNVIAAEAKSLTAVQPATVQPVPQFTTQVPQPPYLSTAGMITPATAPNAFIQPMQLPTLDRQWTSLETQAVQPPTQ